MNFYDSIIVYQDYDDCYNDEDPKLASSKFSDLSNDKKLHILKTAFGACKYIKESKEFLNKEGYYTKEQIKDQKGIAFSNQDKIYFANYSLEELEELNRILCVNHIDFNKQNCKEDNLNTLCLRCNVKINRNREYWTNYFSAQ